MSAEVRVKAGSSSGGCAEIWLGKNDGAVEKIFGAS